MAKATQALPYLRRVLEDEFVQDQLRSAAGSAMEAFSRARKQRTQVVEDKGLYRNLRQAATSLQNATKAIRPEPPPPKHRARKLAIVLLAIAATALITTKLQKQQAQPSPDTGLATSPPGGDAAGPTAGPGPTAPEPAVSA